MIDVNIAEFRAKVKKANRRLFNARRRAPKNLPGRVMAAWRVLSFLWLPMRMVYTAVLLLTLFKVAILLTIGDAKYQQQLASYNENSFSEQIGVFAMTPDPITVKLRDTLQPVLAQ